MPGFSQSRLEAYKSYSPLSNVKFCYLFIGATDNIRKRAELPDSYFLRLKASGIPIEKHLLCEEESQDPLKLKMTKTCYLNFRDRRANEILRIAERIVNP